MNRQALILLLAAATLLAAAVLAPAQSRRNNANRPAPLTADNPILTRHPINKRDWTLISELRILGAKSYIEDSTVLLHSNPIVVDQMDFVFPQLRSSAFHTVHPEGLSTRIRFENTGYEPIKPRIEKDFQGPTDLLRFSAVDINSRGIILRLELPLTSYETRIDEKRALDVPWPPADHQWPPHITANLLPQLFVEPEHPAIKSLVADWTNNKPRRAAPYYLAKYLAGKVVEHYQPTDRILESTGRGITTIDISSTLVSGFYVKGSVAAALEKAGPPLDAANLLTAVYRAAGLPARLVIGYDRVRSLKLQGLVVRAWTEFYLYDPRTDTGQWIPVDIQRQRAFSSKAPPIDQRWQFFGHNEESDFLVPMAFHWHPPTTVTTAGPPSIWGWISAPVIPLVDQSIHIDAIGTPKRGNPND